MTKRILFFGGQKNLVKLYSNYFRYKDFEVIACCDLESAQKNWNEYKGKLSFVLANLHSPSCKGVGGMFLKQVFSDIEENPNLYVPAAIITHDATFKWGEDHETLKSVPILSKTDDDIYEHVITRAIEIGVTRSAMRRVADVRLNVPAI